MSLNCIFECFQNKFVNSWKMKIIWIKPLKCKKRYKLITNMFSIYFWKRFSGSIYENDYKFYTATKILKICDNILHLSHYYNRHWFYILKLFIWWQEPSIVTITFIFHGKYFVKNSALIFRCPILLVKWCKNLLYLFI